MKDMFACTLQGHPGVQTSMLASMPSTCVNEMWTDTGVSYRSHQLKRMTAGYSVKKKLKGLLVYI
eukprot:scaffold259902_cov21-Tisochrysis_lutea.AAC.1